MKDHNLLTTKFEVKLANEAEREQIYRIRYKVYALELGQHPLNPEERLTDQLDGHNDYVIAKVGNQVVGFVSITPPTAPNYSLDKYVTRDSVPFTFDSGLYELRVLTVIKPYRNTLVGLAIMYGGFCYVKDKKGSRTMTIGKLDLVEMYKKSGMIPTGLQMTSGKVTFELMSATMDEMTFFYNKYHRLLSRALDQLNWHLPFSMRPDASEPPCYHGGDFFQAIGNQFATLEKSEQVINADVLDAWFEPAPLVLNRINQFTSWTTRTSPPTYCEGLLESLASHKQLSSEHFLPGAGSSELMFRVLPDLVTINDRVLIMNPTYGEYNHILTNVIGCQVDYFNLDASTHYKVDIDALIDKAKNNYSLIILVNPNSPTGQYLTLAEITKIATAIPSTTKLWIDETYSEYIQPCCSAESLATRVHNIIVCKSLSKVYALSGMRVAYICSNKFIIQALNRKTPPWIIGLQSQISAIAALDSSAYYREKYIETESLRKALIQELEPLNIGSIFEGHINAILIHLNTCIQSAKEFVGHCKKHNLYLRDVTELGHNFQCDVIRIAVKDKSTNQRMVKIIQHVLSTYYTYS